jgi:tetratricopeptide (TPR) repeat protein
VQAGSVAGGIHFHRAPGAEHAHPTPHQLPADTRAFVNRTNELRQLNTVLSRPQGDDLVVSVHVVAGTAGAGKTSLVLHWAHQVKHEFPDGQLFVNLRGYDPGEPVRAQQALRGFLRALGVPAADVPQDLDDAAALYRSLLADRRLLVVLDNAATAGQVRPLLPGGGASLVVVTSRNRLTSLAVRDGARRLTLGTLPEPEAVALLRAVTSGYRPEDDEGKLADLARLCARLPLALRIAAERAASRPHMRLDDLIADLRDESALWATLSTDDEEEADAVRTVFAWSYRALSPQAAGLFRLLGLHPGPEFSLSAAAALGARAPGRARQLLDDLVGAHLLEQIAPDRYQFHDLLRAYAHDLARSEEPAERREAALRRILCWYLHTADAAQTWLQPSEEHLPLPEADVRPLAFRDYDAAADWCEREQGNFPALVRAADQAGLDELTWQLAVLLWFARPPSSGERDWLELGRLGLEAASRLDDAAASIRLNINFGMAYRTLNRFDEGLDHLRTAAALARDSGSRFKEAYALNLIGLIQLRTRRLAAADKCFAQAAAVFQELDHSHLAATVLSNIASTRLNAGRLPEAASGVEQALAAHRALGNRRGEGNGLRIEAELRRELGELDAARRAIDEALEIALLLRDHALEGFWLLTLGDVQRSAGEYGDALASYQRSGILHQRLADRSREALAWRGTGQTYSATGRADEAARFHRRAAAVHRELGDDWQQAVELDLLAAALAAEDPATAREHWAGALAALAPFDDPRAAGLRARVQERLGPGPA